MQMADHAQFSQNTQDSRRTLSRDMEANKHSAVLAVHREVYELSQSKIRRLPCKSHLLMLVNSYV